MFFFGGDILSWVKACVKKMLLQHKQRSFRSLKEMGPVKWRMALTFSLERYKVVR